MKNKRIMKSRKQLRPKSHNLALPVPLQELIIFEDIKGLFYFCFTFHCPFVRICEDMSKKIKTTEKIFKIEVDKDFYLNLVLDHETQEELIDFNIGFAVHCGRDEVNRTLPMLSVYKLLNIAKIEFARYKKQHLKEDTRKRSEVET